MKRICLTTLIISLALAWGCQGAANPPAAPVSTPPSAVTAPAPATETAAPVVQSQADSKFSLDISEPRDSSVVKAPTVRVKGKTLPDAEVRVNDQFVIVDSTGAFTATVSLEAGPNSIEVTATDTAGNEEFRLITVLYLP